MGTFTFVKEGELLGWYLYGRDTFVLLIFSIST